MFVLSYVCFLCLNKSKTLKSILIKDGDGVVVEKKIKFCLSEIVDIKPEIQKNICISCLKNLSAFYAFKQRCLRLNTTLKNHFEKLAPTDESCQQPSENLSNVKEQNKAEAATEDKVITIQYLELIPAENQEDLETPNTETIIKHEIESDSLDIKEEYLLPKEENLQDDIDNTNESAEDTADTEMILDCELTPNSGESSKIVSSEHQDEINQYKTPKKKAVKYKCKKKKDDINLDIRIYRCTLCWKQFLSRITYLKHISEHHSEIHFTECTICNHLFKSKVDLKKHIKICIRYVNFQCPKCQLYISNKFDFAQHAKIHPIIIGLECPFCFKLFNSKKTLERHKQSHIAAKKFQCIYCNKMFLNRTDFFRHEKVQHKLIYFGCTHCNKAFATKDILKRHEKLHSDIKPFECYVCSEKFALSIYLKAHMKSHGSLNTDGKSVANYNDVKYECSICNKVFRHLLGLRIHERGHADPTFKCSICYKMFKYEGFCLRHERTAHPNMNIQRNEDLCQQNETEKEPETDPISVKNGDVWIACKKNDP